MNIWEEIKRRFKSGDTMMKLLFINVGVFLLINLGVIFTRVLQLPFPLLEWLSLPSDPFGFLVKPWTLLTYMFIHYDIWHILFNMIGLYWFGKLFLMDFTQRQLTGVYLLGGIAGGLLYLLSYNIFPFFENQLGTSILLGASASVLAIMLAVTLKNPNQEIYLWMVFRVPLKWLAVGFVIIDLLSMTGGNAGGHIAHLGGALFGVLFVKQLDIGRDMTLGINKLIDQFVVLFRPSHKKKMKVKYRRPKTDYDFNKSKKEEQEVIDQILEKIKKSGYDSLTKEEKKKLFDISNK